jgi:hypothetical protein
MDDVEQVFQEALRRGLQPSGRIKTPRIARDGKWKFNPSDPDGTRMETMGFKPVREPSPPSTR